MKDINKQFEECSEVISKTDSLLPGRVVRIREDLEVREYDIGKIILADGSVYGKDTGCLATTEMQAYKGKTTKIKELRLDWRNLYSLEIDGGGWSWSPSMLEIVK